jgi:hypothetical protein
LSDLTNISNGNRSSKFFGDALPQRKTAPQLGFRERPALERGGAVEGISSLRDRSIARDRATIAPDETEEERSDCWPDWGGRVVVSPDAIQALSRENSPARVFFEIGVILATAFVLVLAAPFLAPPF